MNAIRIVLVVVDAAVGLTAIGGGIALAAGLEGERYPVEWLTGTPFSSYLMPGLILSVAVGGSAAAAAVLIVTTPEVGAWVSVLAGVILTGQIVIGRSGCPRWRRSSWPSPNQPNASPKIRTCHKTRSRTRASGPAPGSALSRPARSCALP